MRITCTWSFRNGSFPTVRPAYLTPSIAKEGRTEGSKGKGDGNSCKRSLGRFGMENSNTCREPIYPKRGRKKPDRNATGRILRRRRVSRERDRHRRRGKKATPIFLFVPRADWGSSLTRDREAIKMSMYIKGSKTRGNNTRLKIYYCKRLYLYVCVYVHVCLLIFCW